MKKPFLILAALLVSTAIAKAESPPKQPKIPNPDWCQFGHNSLPKLIQQSKIQIKEEWFLEGGEIEATAIILVDEDGDVSQVGISPDDLDERILRAIGASILQWEFEPAEVDGESVSSCIAQPLKLVFPRPPTPPVSIGVTDNLGP